MIVMTVRHQHDVDLRETAFGQARCDDSLRDEKPLCQHGIREHRHAVDLDEHGRMADERDANLASCRLAGAGLDVGSAWRRSSHARGAST